MNEPSGLALCAVRDRCGYAPLPRRGCHQGCYIRSRQLVLENGTLNC